jgi:hypothetical protein
MIRGTGIGLLLAAIVVLGCRDVGPNTRAAIAVCTLPLVVALTARRSRRVYPRRAVR